MRHPAAVAVNARRKRAGLGRQRLGLAGHRAHGRTAGRSTVRQCLEHAQARTARCRSSPGHTDLDGPSQVVHTWATEAAASPVLWWHRQLQHSNSHRDNHTEYHHSSRP
ncbi:hypothetical protein H257_04107 [Aphanomyces astaci]|uniref:Uncharacterized protein n=1 Tax=Aphanomyces astaci TaxID=112090 RepID=W4GVL2_APHAT|nr:hypothetical protein H257_04107 [Aphanomyces astaci]ETV83361.1 hypothetical protein H257_04107 [Aphanomyces astaci]|eukprot:XP_009826791.1 hypothetical protein H257_04107 [Aphanomyces astaci]